MMGGRQSILLEPNLYGVFHECITNSMMLKGLATVMHAAGKEVLFGEGSNIVSEHMMIGWRFPEWEDVEGERSRATGCHAGVRL